MPPKSKNIDSDTESNGASNLEVALKEIQKQYGKFSVRKANTIPSVVKISTGIFDLDLKLGGGIPLSRMTLLTGKYHGGKSLIALRTIANAQKMDRFTYEKLIVNEDGEYVKKNGSVATPMICVFLDVENTFDAVWAQKLGIDTSTLLVIKPAYLEETWDILNALIDTGDVDLIVIDSIAAMTPKTELESSAEDNTMGLAARKNNFGFRTSIARLNRLESNSDYQNKRAPAVIFINQIRLKIGVMYGSPETLTGGEGQRFAASVTIKMKSTTPIIEEGTKQLIGKTFNYDIEKNKLTGNIESGNFDMYTINTENNFAGEVDNAKLIVEWATRYNLIEKSSSWMTIPQFEGLKFQGIPKTVEFLKANPEFLDGLEQTILEKFSRR